MQPPSRVGSVVLVLLLSAGCGAAPREATVRLPHVTSRFSNGLALLVAPDATTDLVHVAVRYRTGWGSDPAGKSGLAHLVEHLTYVARSGGESIVARLERLALDFNASTDVDATHYMATGRPKQLMDLLAVEARRIRVDCDQISEETFARELAVVRNELRARFTGGGAVGALLASAFGAGHPYARSAIGDDGELARLTREDACAFLRAHYTADQAIVVVIGRVDPDRVEAIVARFFAAVRGPSARRSPPPAPHPTERRREVSAPVDRPTIYAAWHLPRSTSQDRLPAEMALALVAARISEAGHGDALRVSMATYGGATAPLGVLAIEVLDPSVSLADAERALRRSIHFDGMIVGRTLGAIGRAVALTQTFFRIDSFASRGAAYADLVQEGARGNLLLDALGRAAGIDGQTVAGAARRYLTGERMIEVVARPQAAASLQLGRVGYEGHEDRAAVDQAVDASAAERPLSSTGARRAHVQERFVLPNGLEVVMEQSSTVPTFSARIVFRAGTADDLGGGGAAAGAVYGLRFDDSWHFNPRSVRLVGNGGTMWREVARETSTFAVEGLATWSDVLLAGLGALVIDGGYPGGALTSLRRGLEDPGRGTERAFAAAIAEATWGPRGRNARVLGQTSRVDDQDVARFRRARFTAGNATLIITGLFDARRVRGEVEDAFAGLPRGGAPVERPPGVPRPPGMAVRAIPMAGATAGMLDVVIAVPVPRERDRAAALVLRQLLSRVAGRVRMELGAAYQSSSFHEDDPHGGTLGVVSQVNAEMAGEALRVLRDDLARIARGGDDLAADFVVARRRALEDELAEADSAREAGELLAAAAAHGRVTDDRARLAAEIGRLTLAALRPVAAELLRPDAQAIVIRGPGAAIEATLREAGLRAGSGRPTR